MKEQKARERGYRDTHIYGRNKYDITSRKDIEFVKLGYKAIVVTVPDSPYSRGVISEGYSIFTEQKYFTDKRRKELEAQIADIPRQKVEAEMNYNNKINELDSQREEMANSLLNLE